MVKLNNKGFSLVEIIIAAAVFAILVYPISTALMTATKTTTTSTKKQYAVEKAEEIMENFKTATLADEVPIPDDNGTKAYSFQKNATTSKSVTLSDSSSTVVNYTDTTYACNDISIGQTYENYKCTVDVNDAAYQVMKKGYVLTDLASGSVKKNASGVVQTDISGSGTIRNLDDNQSAIIIGATYNTAAKGRNLDNMAYQYFLDAKVDLLRGFDVQYNHYLSGAGTFDEDHFQKNTIIKVTKLGSTYTVKCTVEYTDYTNVAVIRSAYASSGKNVYRPTTKYGDGVVYLKEFTDVLPPIYLLYIMEHTVLQIT